MKATYGIVIASYRYGHLAAHAIESILAQTKPFDKIWFVDDGAGDCQHLIPLYADRGIQFVLRDTNLGIVDNFNDMLGRVDTDFVMFMGADNWLRPDTLYQLNDALEEYQSSLNPKIIMYDIMVTGELKNQLYQTYHASMWASQGGFIWNRHGFHHGSMLYHAETARQLGGYAHNRTSSRTDEDLNLWDKFKNNGHLSIHVPLPLLYYRRHKENFNKF